MMLLDVTNTLAPTSPTLPTSVGVAIASAYIMHLLKTLKSIPKISFYTTKINLFLRAILSAVGTIGISIKWAAVSGGGVQLITTIPSLTVFLVGLWHWGVQFGLQHMSEGVLQVMRQAADIAKQAAAGDKA